MEVEVARLFDLPAAALAPLVAESEQDGWRFVRRLAEEWADGTNRFDRPGEALLAAWMDGALIGVCGLNVDPYAGEPTIGRVRRLYVLRRLRGRGSGPPPGAGLRSARSPSVQVAAPADGGRGRWSVV
jgi:hypothetical protein